MNIELTGARFLTPVEMSELAALLDSLHRKTITVIDRLRTDVETQRTRIAGRWKGVSALRPVERQRANGVVREGPFAAACI